MQVFTTLDPAALPRPVFGAGYRHAMAPASLGIRGEKDAAGFTTHLGSLRGVLRTFPVYPKESWPNPALRQVVIWAESRPEFHAHVRDSDGDEWTSFRGEYMFVLTMDAAGQHVERVVEFLDSKATGQLMGLIARALKRKEEVEGVRPDDILGARGD